MALPSVAEYFKGKTLFMTGATGFVGRFLMYKILKDCDIKAFYILLREKKGKTLQQRFDEYTSLELFTYLPDKSVLQKIKPIYGDITISGCGLSPADAATIIDTVDIVYHSAATVKFNEPLKSATKLHVYGTNEIVKLVKKIVHLGVFIHVSSLGAFCAEDVLEERVMDSPVHPINFMNRMDQLSDEQAAKLEDDYVGKPPKYLNTYTFTKTLAETVVYKERESYTCGLVRPPFLYSCAKEPEVGWFDTPQTGAGLGVLFSLGLARMADLRLDDPVECIPVDLCVNALVTTCWYMGTVAKSKGEKFKVFNMGMSRDFAITGRELQSQGIELGYMYPSTKQIRPPNEPYNFVPTKQYIRLKAFVTQTLFAYFIDFLLIIIGQKPILVNLTRKVLGAVSTIFEKICHYKAEFHYEMKNLDLIHDRKTGILSEKDKETFFYDLKAVDWRAVGIANHMRFRRTILKEPDSNLPWARKRLKMIEVGYKVFKIFVWALIFGLGYGVHALVSFAASPMLTLVFWLVVAYLTGIVLWC